MGGGTGAVMTAVTMIFEMTLDGQIVRPMILSVAAVPRPADIGGVITKEYVADAVPRGHSSICKIAVRCRIRAPFIPIRKHPVCPVWGTFSRRHSRNRRSGFFSESGRY